MLAVADQYSEIRAQFPDLDDSEVRAYANIARDPRYRGYDLSVYPYIRADQLDHVEARHATGRIDKRAFFARLRSAAHRGDPQRRAAAFREVILETAADATGKRVAFVLLSHQQPRRRSRPLAVVWAYGADDREQVVRIADDDAFLLAVSGWNLNPDTRAAGVTSGAILESPLYWVVQADGVDYQAVTESRRKRRFG